MLSNRVKKVKPSATLGITAKAKEMKNEGIDIVSLAAGEPDFDTPEHIKKALYDSVEKKFIYYTPSQGILELREAIAEKLEKKNRILYDPASEVIATPGAKQALYEAIAAITNPGDEILIPDPGWVSYVPMVQLADGVPTFVPTYEEEGFRLTPDAVKERITKKTKAIIINSPNNPTGAVLEKKDLKEIADVCVENNILVVSDEIYEPMVYGVKHYSIASFEGMKERTIVINGFSKAYSMTGWRLGYAAGPADIIKAMTRIQEHSVSQPTSFVQKAGVVALRSSQNCVTKMIKEFKKRRDVIVKRLREIKGVTCVEPKGAFYAFPNFSKYEKDSLKLANYLLNEAKVAVIPGIAFGEHGEGFLRLSYATNMQNIIKGVDRINKAVKKYG